MLGELNEKQIDELLKRQVTGRLGCHADGITYIVPINYLYKDGMIYAHSGPGKKIEMMRSNPQVCFQADEMESIFRWRSVIAWGVFEEITDIDEQQQAMQGLIHRIMPFVSTPSGHPSHGITANESDIGTDMDLIVYRIRITTKTGRYEQS
ncbi:pyridoxamine 5'-phosphate oxidase family protein [Mucilaginibacter sp. RS28]|uniref:Pyridoxamine 5'-phosphate oxidase family protein n=1 Tax=Mucilaginibacter straminoryzae TaxID=2932774 RepID=A0A9X2BBJ8_9SPHI|nr:pyridoxamine 5'-phosphate oxidase family protein [Mucilaginibacter straminoryzae]MCJ8208353.1 pyridoxamine 5'-phosphate oxidase family protein [Mucilaginibacter straminoryzae]